MRVAVACTICKVFSAVDSMSYPYLCVLVICLGGLLVASIPQYPGSSQPTVTWQLPTPEQMLQSLTNCGSESEETDEQGALQLRCMVEQLGLWTDDRGYHANRIAKIFAGYNQMEELQLVIEYCNERERHPEEPAKWAYQAYRCATSGRFGRWVKDYVKNKQRFK